MRRYAIVLCLAWMPTLLSAQCEGRDIRPGLRPEVVQEVAQAVAETPYPAGNFWRATRDGRSLTLIGTVHVDDPRLDAVADAFAKEVAQADVVFLEMTEGEREGLMARLAADPDMIVLPEGSLIDLLPEDTWSMLAEAAAARGVPGPMAARLQPWYLSLVLALPPCILAAGEVPNGLDARIEVLAQADAIPIRALEAYDTLFRLFADAPIEAQLDMLSASVMDEAAAEDMLATTLELYFEEAHAELWHLSRITARDHLALPPAQIDAMFADLEATLLTARNRAWAETLAAAPERRIVAAFGAAHLFGETGLLALLAQTGHEITRLSLPD